MKFLPFVILVLALAIAIPVRAQNNDTFTGNELHSFCQSVDKRDIAFCRGYIIGFIRGTIVFGSEKSSNRLNIPEDVTRGQITDIVIKYLENHPEYRHFNADVLIFSAVLDTFPPKIAARNEN